MDIMWFSMDGTDSGRVYEKSLNHTCDMIYDAGHVEINNCVINEHRTYIFFIMSDGNILITKVNPDNARDFSTSWQLALHSFNRFSSQTCFSYNEKYLFTCWRDGNIFSYKININEEPTKLISPRSISRQCPKEVEDNDGYTKLSLEELKMKIKHDLKCTTTNRNRETLRQRLQSLRAQFEDLLKRNSALPSTQIIPKQEFEIHPLITQFFKDEHQVNLACVNRDHAVQIEISQIKLWKTRNRFTDPLDCFPITVKGISSRGWVKTIPQRKLAKEFHDALILVEEKMKAENETAEWKEKVMSFSGTAAIENPLERQKRVREKKDVFMTLLAQEKNFGPKINQLLERYKIRRIHFQKRKQEVTREENLVHIN
uniref:Uncharacterized protein n=2 Tax=Photinus pyralis TaxID=7054 RepID=A0A1Y1JZ53_PHOPY